MYYYTSMSLQRTVLLLSKITAIVVVLAAAYLLSSGRVYIASSGPAAEAAVELVKAQRSRDGDGFISPTFERFRGYPLQLVRNENREEVSPEENSMSLPPENAETNVHYEDSEVPEQKDDEISVDTFSDIQRDDLSSDELNVNGYQTDDIKDTIAFNERQTSGTSGLNFTVRKGFKFPHPQMFLPVATVLGAQWVKHLKDYLLAIHPARSLTITVATEPFIPNLLNWLIASQLLVDPPIQHVLALGFDKDVHQLLASKNLPCIHVPMNSVVKGNRKGVAAVWMTRFAVLRLLNHWGYDVLQLDSDAVPLKNPQFLFNAYPEYDIVSARGILPFELGKGPWGFTVCMGAALLRATQKMGEI